MGKKRFKEFCERILLWWRNSFFFIRLFTCSEAREHVQTYSSTKGFSFWDEICKGTRYYIKFKTLYQCHNIVSISSHCRPINFESLYQLRVIVSVSSHCINFESLYQSFIKSKLTLYFFLDFLFISKHRSETSYSLQESAYISVFPCHWKEAKITLSRSNLFTTCKYHRFI